MDLKPQVVHFKKEPYDVYIGRPFLNDPGLWGNPFSSKPHAKSLFKTKTKAESLWKYKDWLMAQPELLRKIKKELKGKILGCWCDNTNACHGVILWKIANEVDDTLNELPIKKTLFE